MPTYGETYVAALKRRLELAQKDIAANKEADAKYR